MNDIKQHTSERRSNPYAGTELEPIFDHLRTMVRGTYDLQKLRVGTGNRIAANFRSKLGIQSSQPEEDLEDDEDAILKQLRLSYKRITDGIVANANKTDEDDLRLPSEKSFKGDALISHYTELVLVHEYMELLKREEKQFRTFMKFIKKFPIYDKWLKDVKGVGPAMAGVLICEINIKETYYSSGLWALCGLDVGPDGRGRGRFKEHLVDKQYIDKEGKEQTKKSITFNPFLKTKMLGVLATSFLRAKGPYSEHYYNYKHRIETDPRHADKSKGHRHRMALRYMIKRFLVDLYTNWRTIEGLPVSVEYHEGKQGHKHRA